MAETSRLGTEGTQGAESRSVQPFYATPAIFYEAPTKPANNKTALVQTVPIHGLTQIVLEPGGSVVGRKSGPPVPSGIAGGRVKA